MTRFRSGFTLIELLIVVAIIAILAAIAVPNFLEAQIRSKVSRAKADMRTLATGIESYNVDWNTPVIGGYALNTLRGAFPNELDVLVPLSTPVAYITNPHFKDPFADVSGTQLGGGNVQASQFGVYRYDSAALLSSIPESGNSWNHYRAAEKNYTWWTYSYGPSGNAEASTGAYRYYGEFVLSNGWYPLEVYDPTNGTVSKGLVMRTNKGEYTGADYNPQ